MNNACLSAAEAALYLERDPGVTQVERAWIDEHLRTCGACAGLCARVAGVSEPKTEEEAKNVIEWRRPT